MYLLSFKKILIEGKKMIAHTSFTFVPYYKQIFLQLASTKQLILPKWYHKH